jgi:ABC-type transporter Mla subunit MlaD
MWVINALFPIFKTLQQPTFNNVLTSTWIIITILLGVILGAFYYRNWRKCRELLSSALKYLEDKSPDTVRENYVSISREMENILGSLWSAYARSLVKIQDNSGRSGLYSTTEARWFFNENTIIIPRLNTNFYNSVPGAFTGFGILGTFVGLTIGLAQLNISDAVEGLRQGIEGLLSGMSIAFSSSLWGILLSLAFLVFTKLSLNKLQFSLGKLQQVIDNLFPCMTAEQLLVDCLWEAREQSRELKRFNEDLAISIATALDEKLANRLDPTFGDLLKAIEQLARMGSSELSRTISSQMGAEIERLSKTLELVGASLRSISDYTTSSQEKLNISIENLLSQFSNNISDVLSGLRQQQETMSDHIESSINSFAGQLKEVAAYMQQSVKEQMAQVVGSVGDMSTTMSGQVTTILERMETFVRDYERERAELEKQWQKMSETTKIIQEAMNTFARSAEPVRQATDQLQITIKQWDEKQRAFSSILEKNQQQLNSYIEYTRNILEGIKTSNTQLQTAWQAYEKRFDNLRQDLEKVFEELSKGLTEYTQITSNGVETFLQGLDKYLASITNYLSGAIENLKEPVSDLSEAVERLGKLHS